MSFLAEIQQFCCNYGCRVLVLLGVATVYGLLFFVKYKIYMRNS